MENRPNFHGKKGRSGRKTKGHELALVEWYESVLPKVFSEVKVMLESKVKKDRLWAMDWLKTGLVKMIPQRIGGDPDNRTPIPLLYAISNNNRNSKDIQTQ